MLQEFLTTTYQLSKLTVQSFILLVFYHHFLINVNIAKLAHFLKPDGHVLKLPPWFLEFTLENFSSISVCGFDSNSDSDYRNTLSRWLIPFSLYGDLSS